jgi:catechol 2,3-dioxygenase-like lactoylglutathione lyase family enzyme
MIDHVTLRVSDLERATATLAPALAALEIEQSTSSPSLSRWGGFILTQFDSEHPVTRGLHVAFVAPSPQHVDRFANVGLAAELVDGGAPGPRPHYAADYYAAFLIDDADNSFEAVHRASERPAGRIDHVGVRVADLDASRSFYSAMGPSAGLAEERQLADRTVFAVGTSGSSILVIADEPTEHAHIAFSGDDDDVQRFHADLTGAGYRSNGEPGERPRYHPGYYAAFVLDPDGNNIEVVNHHR